MSDNEKGKGSPTDFNECVSKDELTGLVTEQRTYMQEQFDTLTRQLNGLVTRIEHVEQRPPPVQPADDDEFKDVDPDEERLQCNHFQIGGGNYNRGGGNQNRGNNDPFAKVKFTMIPFAGSADPEVYLDWELAVNQKFNSHQVPEEHRIRLATSEFTSFALFWWNDLCNVNNVVDIPQT
jgi:hypothetical protein